LRKKASIPTTFAASRASKALYSPNYWGTGSPQRLSQSIKVFTGLLDRDKRCSFLSEFIENRSSFREYGPPSY